MPGSEFSTEAGGGLDPPARYREVAGKSVSTPAEVLKVIDEARSGGKRTVLIRVKKGDSNRFVALPVGNG